MLEELDNEKVDEKLKEDGFVVIAEFECTPPMETFVSTGRMIDDGAGYYDIKSDDECPFCERSHHWKTVKS